jgi:hypothetical protein
MIWDLIGLVANPRDCIEVIKCSDACCVQLPQISGYFQEERRIPMVLFCFGFFFPNVLV